MDRTKMRLIFLAIISVFVILISAFACYFLISGNSDNINGMVAVKAAFIIGSTMTIAIVAGITFNKIADDEGVSSSAE